MEVTHATRALRARIRSTVSPAHALQASEDQHVVRVSNFPDVKGEIRKGIFLSSWIDIQFMGDQIAIYFLVNSTNVFDISMPLFCGKQNTKVTMKALKSVNQTYNRNFDPSAAAIAT